MARMNVGETTRTGDDSSEGNDSHFSRTTLGHSEKSVQEENEAIAKAESQAVFWIRVIVALLLVSSTIVVAILVHHYTMRSQIGLFQKQFESSSSKVYDALRKNLELFFGTTDTFVSSIMQYARATNATFPFVTYPDFAIAAAKILALSNSVTLREFVVVEEHQREAWENYSVANDGWVEEGLQVQKTDPNYFGVTGTIEEYIKVPFIYGDHDRSRAEGPGPYAPSWQTAPINGGFYNYDGITYPVVITKNVRATLATKKAVISETNGIPFPDNPIRHERQINFYTSFLNNSQYASEPFNIFSYPMIHFPRTVASEVTDDTKLVGVMCVVFFWRFLIEDLLPRESVGIILVFENECAESHTNVTFRLDGPDATYLGAADFHDSEYDDMGISAPLLDQETFITGTAGSYTGVPFTEEYCKMKLHVYPSDDTKAEYVNDEPLYFATIAAMIFMFTSCVFIVYDRLSERRQRVVMMQAVQSSKIVSSLFPSNVRDRLYDNDNGDEGMRDSKSTWRSMATTGLSTVTADKKSAPIADHFPETSVLFMDIAGFTAWSSIRDPVQVFTLLEAVYGAFDTIANNRGIFKVETIGDSYVACAGLPTPRKDHAVAMVRFARDARTKMALVTAEVAEQLGPDTAELRLRIGLHSGSVTGGVLRGEKSRFQLFGDTVNTASRMESNGQVNRIQCSQGTADELIKHGKGGWLVKREDLVEAKGKGKMQTYWVEPRTTESGRSGSLMDVEEKSSDSGEDDMFHAKVRRLVKWNVDVFTRAVKKVVSSRVESSVTTVEIPTRDTLPMQEVKDVLLFPEALSAGSNLKSIDLSLDVSKQLEEFIAAIAAMHPKHPFHNFEHTSYGIVTVSKLLSSIVAPEASKEAPETLLYTVVSDPLVQFACILSVLIQDVDHPGISNAQMIEESSFKAVTYKNRSVAEQNSLDLAWSLFEDEQFEQLRATVCPRPEDLAQLRQLAVNLVLATDVDDMRLREQRQARWQKANNDIAMRTTLLLESLSQVGALSHTLRQWSVFEQWNEKKWDEAYAATMAGRGGAYHPGNVWYEEQLDLFDRTVLPLARELEKACIFGSVSSEYLSDAEANRQRWVEHGAEIVAELKGN